MFTKTTIEQCKMVLSIIFKFAYVTHESQTTHFCSEHNIMNMRVLPGWKPNVTPDMRNNPIIPHFSSNLS